MYPRYKEVKRKRGEGQGCLWSYTGSDSAEQVFAEHSQRPPLRRGPHPAGTCSSLGEADKFPGNQ